MTSDPSGCQVPAQRLELPQRSARPVSFLQLSGTPREYPGLSGPLHIPWGLDASSFFLLAAPVSAARFLAV